MKRRSPSNGNLTALASPFTPLSSLFAGTLELKAEKQSAHSSYINSVAFSPDGKTVVSGSSDKRIPAEKTFTF